MKVIIVFLVICFFFLVCGLLAMFDLNNKLNKELNEYKKKEYVENLVKEGINKYLKST